MKKNDLKDQQDWYYINALELLEAAINAGLIETAVLESKLTNEDGSEAETLSSERLCKVFHSDIDDYVWYPVNSLAKVLMHDKEGRDLIMTRLEEAGRPFHPVFNPELLDDSWAEEGDE